MSDARDAGDINDGEGARTGPSASRPLRHQRHCSELFVWPVRVYHEDTDGGGIVYHANHLRFMERARTVWLRAVGIEQAALKEEHGLMFVVVDVEAHYRRPARYGEMLQVSCMVREVARASLTFTQEIYRDRIGGELLLDGTVRVACLDAATYRPRPLPAIVRALWGSVPGPQSACAPARTPAGG